MHLAKELLRELDTPGLSLNERAHLRCRIAKQLEQAGDYDAASEAMAELWKGVGARPNLEGLDDEKKAEVLLRVGSLTGWIGSVSQIEGSQEMAKDLISESLRSFDQLGQRSSVGEARSNLAVCYWRIGAFDEARVTLEMALSELRESDVEQRTIALIWKAEVERASQRLNEALLIYRQTIPLIDKVNDHSLAAHFHNGLANTLNQLSSIENRPDYVDRALIEYAAASFHFEEAGHERYQGCVENNIGYLLGIIGKFEEAHEHLDRAQMLMTRLKDNVHLAQVDETRARVLLAEGRLVEAEKTARAAVLRLEPGDELSLLAEALTTHGIALARLDHSDQARTSLERAITIAEQVGDSESAGVAALAVLEQLATKLSNEDMRAAIDHVGVLLEMTKDTSTLRRLARTFQSLFLAQATPATPDWTNFSLKQTVLRYESHLIKLALLQSDGSVTKAARLLGFNNHQSLVSLIASRHRELLTVRSAIRKRRQHLMPHAKRKQKQSN
jgi:tetratricopeptide (TPR) repeat protein